MLHDSLRECLVALLVVQLVLPPSLCAKGGGYPLSQPEFFAQSEHTEEPLPAELAEIIAELEGAAEHTPVRDIPDPFHLTQQYLLVMRGDGNSSDRYHLAGTEGGLPRIVPQPNLVKAVNFDGKLGLRYKHGVHVIESIAPALIAYDRELLVVIATDGSVYALDLTFARHELFKAPLPVHKLPLVIESENLSGLQTGFITRGFNPFTQVLTERGTVQTLSATQRFTAGDLVLWREREEQRVLVSVVARDVIVTAINNGNHLLGSLAYALRKDKSAALQQALAYEQLQGQQVDTRQLSDYRDQSSAALEQVLQSMDVERLQEMLLNDIEMNSYRDDFTYAHWQRDYLLLKKQAEVTVKNLKRKFFKDGTTKKHIRSLEQQLRRGDLGDSWVMLSKLYVEEARDLLIDRINVLKRSDTPAARAKITELESIIAANDFHRLWNEPQLLTGEEERLASTRLHVSRFVYQHLSGENLRHLASTAAGIGGLGVLSYAAARALKTGFTLARFWPPAPFKLKDLPHSVIGRGTAQTMAVRVGYSRYLKIATVLGVAIIPAVAAVGWLTARSSGEDWSFRKQLTLIGIRAYATLSRPFYYYLAEVAGQKTLMPSLAAQLSPFTEVHGNTALGESIGLKPSQSVRVGWQPFAKQSEDDEALRRRAISALQQQRARAQALGWEMAARLVWQEWLKGRQLRDIDAYDDLATTIQQSGFQQRWKQLAVGLEAEIAKLQREGIFPDLRTVSSERVYDFIARTKPRVLDLSYHANLLRTTGRVVQNLGSVALAWGATVATDNVNFLQIVDPDDFVASMIWQSFMIDFFTVVVIEGTYGARAKVFGSADDIKSLLATNKFPNMHSQHRETLADQLYAYQIKGQGRYSLLFQMLEKIKESNYTPLEETLLVGKKNPQSFSAGLFDLASNITDLRNTDYGSRYVRDVSVQTAMMQSAILGTIVTRALIAKVAIGSVLPQFFFKLFWGMWGYAWPWIIIYSSEHLREKKHTTRLGMLRQAKVQLRKALDRDDSDGMQRGYLALIEVYRNFNAGVPPALQREVEQIEADLRISAAERLSEAELLSHFAALVQMNASDDPALKRAIYRQISAQIDNEQPEQALTRVAAARVLNFVMLNPPFPTQLNSRVRDLAIAIGAVATTLMGSWFFRGSFNFKRLRDVLPYMAAGATVYTGTWLLLEKRHVRKIWSFIREEVLGYPPDRAAQY